MSVPKGTRIGGRQKGTPNKKTADMIAAIAKGGEMPLDYMLRVMRDQQVEYPRRDDMAKSVAPYLHPRLAAVEHKGDGGGPIQVTITGTDANLL